VMAHANSARAAAVNAAKCFKCGVRSGATGRAAIMPD
jgi:hypothetical protein